MIMSVAMTLYQLISTVKNIVTEIIKFIINLFTQVNYVL